MNLIPIDVTFFEKKSVDGHRKMPVAHFHDKHELYFLESGKTKYFVENEMFILEEGDIIFIPKGTLHRTEGLGAGSLSRSILYFTDEDFEESYLPYIENLKKCRLVKFHHNNLHIVQNIFSEINKENEKMREGYAKMQKLYLCQLLINIERYRIDNARKNLGRTFRLAENISKYICENFGSDLSLAHLSEKYGVTPEYLSRFFKKTTGVGLNEYINIVRVTEAEKLLLNTNKSITEIAFECGFNDSNYFSAVFKKSKGITPKKFSKMNTAH